MAHLSGLGQHRIALSFYLRAHQRHLREYGEDALATLDVAENIAFTLQELGDHEAARAVDADLLPRFERAAGKGGLGFERLVKALRALGCDAEADEIWGESRSSDGVPAVGHPFDAMSVSR
ncbi:tetratricopeptide repeat protein [Streptomyces laculatispora]|uniref:Tetratricopeptide repeat protein n=1 Tax=Streptomyces laculatispora TaxID=887464 RepID=A0ABY9IDE0_9ACTN|nr:tetratricopeptide repeat protein [Streptomyces laculatispora]WLQ44426.1 tetratricopeptide repeat protein [Streptomyces laculatispora]